MVGSRVARMQRVERNESESESGECGNATYVASKNDLV